VTFDVTDEHTNPVEGATVTLNGMEETTNAEGKAEFLVVSGIYDYSVSMVGYHTVEDQVEVSHDDVTVPVTLIPGEFTITFEVTDSDADPIEGATVTLNGMEATTLPDGTALFENMADGTYAYTVSKVGYLTAEGTVDVIDEDVTEVVVLASLESIAAAPEDADLGFAGSGARTDVAQLTVTATYTDASTADVTDEADYESDDPSVATVSETGLITAVGEGSAIITVSYDGHDTTVSVTVQFDPWLYDVNENEEIEKTEALFAVQDYFNDEIAKQHVLEVIQLYFAS